MYPSCMSFVNVRLKRQDDSGCEIVFPVMKQCLRPRRQLFTNVGLARSFYTNVWSSFVIKEMVQQMLGKLQHANTCGLLTHVLTNSTMSMAHGSKHEFVGQRNKMLGPTNVFGKLTGIVLYPQTLFYQLGTSCYSPTDIPRFEKYVRADTPICVPSHQVQHIHFRGYPKQKLAVPTSPKETKLKQTEHLLAYIYIFEI